MHEHGKLLLVDEAHGAHYGFHEEVPASALSQGADAVVQSTHKMLTAMTMGAMLHVQGPRITEGLSNNCCYAAELKPLLSYYGIARLGEKADAYRRSELG